MKPMIYFIIFILMIGVASAVTLTANSVPSGVNIAPYNASMNFTILNDTAPTNINYTWQGTNYRVYDSSLVLWLGMNQADSNTTFTPDKSVNRINATVVNSIWTSGSGYYLREKQYGSNISIPNQRTLIPNIIKTIGSVTKYS